MKNKTNSFRLLPLLFTVFSLLITSCGHDPIFNIINNEVKPEKNGIGGHINSFVTFKNNVYIATNFIYQKTLSPSTDENLNGQWKRIESTPFYKKRDAVYLAADSNYLYAYTVTYGLDEEHTNIPDSVIIYYTSDLETWSSISNDKINNLLNNTFKSKIFFEGNKEGTATSNESNQLMRLALKIFDNQTTVTENKNAYITLVSDIKDNKTTIEGMKTELYKLDGPNDFIKVDSGTNNSLNMDTVSEKTEASYSPQHSITAVNYEGSDYFFEYTSIVADENYIYLSAGTNKIMVADGWSSEERKTHLTDVFKTYTIDNYGFTFNGVNCEDAKTLKTNSNSIISMAITKDYLLLGTETGIAHVELGTDRIPGTELQAFKSNAASVLHSPYHVTNIFVVDPSKNEENTDIYASNEYPGYYTTSTTALFEDIGLWAYYPSRKNWNKDGTSNPEDKATHLPAGN